MSKITLDNLSKSLKDIIEENGLTEEQVKELIKNVNGDLNNLYTTDKSSIVGAINELFQSANNGKQLIANAIGEPVSAEDTFSAMSSDINGLLSTFKTNMMNNGITVESGDKFKALIDKIKGLTEGEGNKGIQIAEGTLNKTITLFGTGTAYANSKTVIDFSPGFVPTIIFVRVNAELYNFARVTSFWITNSSTTSNFDPKTSDVSHSQKVNLINITDTSFTVDFYSKANTQTITLLEWYAIGVGEEDTTLRDSLASILTEEGVSVTEEDDMASLITKVDGEFTDKNNEIGDMKQGLINTLTSKGVKVDDNLSFNEILDLVNVQVPPTLVLYDNGYVNTEIVGSFTRAYEGIFSGSTVMEMNEDHINVNVKVNPSSSNAAKRIWGGIYSELAINTSKYRALHVEYSRGNNTGSLSVGMDANKQINADSKTSVNYTAGAPVTELNTKYIATCTFTPGNFYFLAFIYVGYVNVTCNFKIHRIWLDSIID